MKNEIYKDSSSQSDLISFADTERFSKLTLSQQNKIIETISAEPTKDSGIMGKFFGNNPENSVINISLVMCTMLLIVLLIDSNHLYNQGKDINMELVNIIVPVFTLTLGYLFGKGSHKS